MGKKKKGTNAPNENPNLNCIANECVFVGPITINKIPSQVLDQHAWWRHLKKSERPTGAENMRVRTCLCTLRNDFGTKENKNDVERPEAATTGPRGVD